MVAGTEGFAEEGLRISDEDGKAGTPMLELELVVTGLTGVEDEAGTFGTGTGRLELELELELGTAATNDEGSGQAS